MRNTFNRNKAKLTIAALAAGLGLHLASHAQAANDGGTLIINGQISASTCVLSFGDGSTGSTGNGSKTLSLGNVTTGTAGTTDGATFGTAQSVVFSLQTTAGTGATCTLGAGNTLWDIGINPQLLSGQVSSITNGANAVLLSSGTSGMATGVGVLIRTSTGPSVTTGTTNLNLLRGAYLGNTLLSGSDSFPAVLPANRIALTAQFVKLGGTAATAGGFSATLPLNVWYR